MATKEAPLVSASTAGMDVSYVEVYDEPMHPTVLENDFVRVLKVACPAHHDTKFHRHSQDSFFLFFQSAQIRNEVVGKEPIKADLKAGSFYWGDHLANPIVHKICVSGQDLDCMDVEIKADRPKPPTLRMAMSDTSTRTLCFENGQLRAYRIQLPAGGTMDQFEFPCLVVMMTKAVFRRGEVKRGARWWCEDGDILGENVGNSDAEVMILEPR